MPLGGSPYFDFPGAMGDYESALMELAGSQRQAGRMDFSDFLNQLTKAIGMYTQRKEGREYLDWQKGMGEQRLGLQQDYYGLAKEKFNWEKSQLPETKPWSMDRLKASLLLKKARGEEWTEGEIGVAKMLWPGGTPGADSIKQWQVWDQRAKELMAVPKEKRSPFQQRWLEEKYFAKPSWWAGPEPPAGLTEEEYGAYREKQIYGTSGDYKKDPLFKSLLESITFRMQQSEKRPSGVRRGMPLTPEEIKEAMQEAYKQYQEYEESLPNPEFDIFFR